MREAASASARVAARSIRDLKNKVAASPSVSDTVSIATLGRQLPRLERYPVTQSPKAWPPR